MDKLGLVILTAYVVLCLISALEALFGPDFDLVTSARFLPKTVLGIIYSRDQL